MKNLEIILFIIIYQYLIKSEEDIIERRKEMEIENPPEPEEFLFFDLNEKTNNNNEIDIEKNNNNFSEEYLNNVQFEK